MADRATRSHPKNHGLRVCCACGMVHGPSLCVYLDHLSRGYVQLRNEMDELKRRLAKKKAVR
jgi:hypothetical protein